MAQIRNEIYDDNGLLHIEYIDILNDLTTEELIAQKQEQLLQIYSEIQQLQSGSL